jgi:GT2 family glycosyltransferase
MVNDRLGHAISDASYSESINRKAKMNLESYLFKIGVVLPNWNGGEFTIPCIRSLLMGECVPWRILVFDNGSTDGSPQKIQQLFAYVDQIRADKNIGFMGGNNEGMRYLLLTW